MAALVKKATKLIKQGKLNAIEPVKKHKANWPSAEEAEEAELCPLDAELKDFNYKDLGQMDLHGESDEEKEEGEEEGEMDISASEEVSDEVSV